MVLKGIEEGLFQLVYFLKISKKSTENLGRNLAYLSTFAGLLLLPIVFYNALDMGKPKILWGGKYETGNFYSIFALSSIILLILEKKEKRYTRALMLLFLTIIYLSVSVYAAKRAPILGFAISITLLIIVIYRSKWIGRSELLAFGLVISLFFGLGYIYLSQKDPRFQMLNKIVTGDKQLSRETLSTLLTGRNLFFLDALKIIQNDIKECNTHYLLIGHGVRSGEILPHWNTPPGFQRYESIFILSEFIEKGIIGTVGEIILIVIAFRRFISTKIDTRNDLFSLFLYIPLIHHIGSSLFTFFWDAVLPVYLLLFKTGEVYFLEKDRSSRNPHLSG